MHACDVYMMIRHEIGLAHSLDRLSLARHFVRRTGGRGRTDGRIAVCMYTTTRRTNIRGPAVRRRRKGSRERESLRSWTDRQTDSCNLLGLVTYAHNRKRDLDG